MDNLSDVVTKTITIEYGIDGETGQPFWAAKFVDNIDGAEPNDIISLGLLARAGIELAQQCGMIPRPDNDYC